MRPILACLLIVALPVLTAQAEVGRGGFTPDLFERFVDMRTGGDGSPVYWYSTGTLKAYPSGEVLATMEGFDTARLIREGDLARQLSRKTYIFRDPISGQRLTEIDGQPISPIQYPYQLITYALDGEFMTTTVEQGRAPAVQTIGPSSGIGVKMIGETAVYTAPLFLDFPIPGGRYQAFENYDFFIHPDSTPREQRYQLSWVRYGAAPPFNDGGPVIMHMVSWRLDSFDALPGSMKDYVLKEAPLWQEPPKDLAEIRALQQPASDQEASTTP